VKKPQPQRPKGGRSAHLVGLGLDNQDGHKRVTQGEKFAIVGGSSETHERMTETVIKTFEELKSRGKSLEKVEPAELSEILDKSTPR
jgi:hypothetical protein